MPEDFELQNLVIRGTIFLEDESDKIIEIFNDLKNVDKPEALDSQIVNIDEDNPESSALVFSDGLPEEPVIGQGTVEMILLSIDDDNDISISIDLSPELYSSSVELVNTLLGHKKLHITDFDFAYLSESNFSEFNVSIEGPSELDFSGVKFSAEGYDFIVQSSDGSQWLHPEEPDQQSDDPEEVENNSTSASVYHQQHFDVEESGEFVRDRIMQVNEILELLVE